MTNYNTRYQSLIQNLDLLKLGTIKEHLPNYIEAMNNKETTFTEADASIESRQVKSREFMIE